MKRWEHIAERVNVATTPRPLTKGEIAKRLDMSRPALDRRLSGQTDWEYDKLEQLASLLGITLEELVGGNGNTILESDLAFEYFHAEGQPVHQGPRGVKLTHKPTGAVIISGKEKSQLENTAAALRALKAEMLVENQSAINDTHVGDTS